MKEPKTTLDDSIRVTVVGEPPDHDIHLRVTTRETDGDRRNTSDRSHAETAHEPAGKVIAPPPDPDDPALRDSELIAGRWRLNRLIDKGGFAAVWEAHDMKGEGYGRRAALKIALQSPDPSIVEARNSYLRDEARILARLGHCHNIVRFMEDDITSDNRVVLVLEHLDGHTLDDARRAAGGRFPVTEALRYIIQVVWALRVAHADDVLHRDLTPRNIFIHKSDSEGPMVKLIDFNIAKRVDQDGVARTAAAGTHGYKAPELLGASPAPRFASFKSDQWSLAAVAVECIIGDQFLRSRERAELAANRRLSSIEVLEGAAPDEVPKELLQVLARALDDDPAGRWPNINAFGLALLAFSDVGTQGRWHRSLTHAPEPRSNQVSASIVARPELQNRFKAITGAPPLKLRPRSSMSPAPPPPPVQAASPPAVRTRLVPVLAGAAAVFLVAGGAFAWRRHHQAPPLPPPAWLNARPVAESPKPAPASAPTAAVATPPLLPPVTPAPSPAPPTLPSPAPAAAPNQPPVTPKRVHHRPKPTAVTKPLVDEKGFPILW